ncbi:hypothetical protein Goshw_015299 [Gossypium schwendimanii]|uniref:Uncharacterized protein n=1 Tax=Gossypium schwendimanii TaxID=34291 RepID=A0A7J9KSB6_GOSSC|nr:hypothetical protein [Gossypium schwendimanii]
MDRYQRVERPKAETPIDEKEIRISDQGKLIKKRIVGLHQITSIGSTNITDMVEPLEEGLVPLETTRHVSIITITLSKIELDMSSIGNQPPLPVNRVKAGITIVAMVEAEGEVPVAVDVDTMDNRLIGWKMEATIMKSLPKVAVARN